MKNFIYSLLFLLPSSIIAQTYHPFPDSSAIWRMEECMDENPFCGFLCGPYCFNRYSVFISGDTLIDSTLYHKLYKGDILASDTLASNYTGAIREVNKKVYLYLDSLSANNISNFCKTMNGLDTSILNKDLLLYDFDVAVGDTFFMIT